MLLLLFGYSPDVSIMMIIECCMSLTLPHNNYGLDNCSWNFDHYSHNWEFRLSLDRLTVTTLTAVYLGFVPKHMLMTVRKPKSLTPIHIVSDQTSTQYNLWECRVKTYVKTHHLYWQIGSSPVGDDRTRRGKKRDTGNDISPELVSSGESFSRDHDRYCVDMFYIFSLFKRAGYSCEQCDI